MYNTTRQEAAEQLSISTRSVDRYVRAGKLRAKKQGKIIYIHDADIEAISGKSEAKQEVIIPKAENTTPPVSNSTTLSKDTGGALEKIYLDLRSEIQKKDTLIQNLSLQLGEAKEIAKNSISLVEFKKSQFLLEESKGYLNKEIEEVKEENEELQKKLSYEKSTNYILISFVIILLVVLGIVWFMSV